MSVGPSGEPTSASLREPAEAVREAIARSSRSVSIAFIDVVGVGTVNRRLGRAAGDGLLQAFECSVMRAIQPPDRLWRLGGDEYLLLMPGGSAHRSERRVRRLHRRVSGALVALGPGQSAALSFRAGGATIAAPGGTLRELYVAASHELQRAKRLDAPVTWSAPGTAPVARSRTCARPAAPPGGEPNAI